MPVVIPSSPLQGSQIVLGFHPIVKLEKILYVVYFDPEIGVVVTIELFQYPPVLAAGGRNVRGVQHFQGIFFRYVRFQPFS
jgi:hypothetical protein